MNLRAIAVAIPASIALVGCGNEPTPAPAPATVTETAPTTQAPEPTREAPEPTREAPEPTPSRGGSTADVNSTGDPILDQVFEEVATDSGYVPRYGSIEELRDLAVKICRAFDEGVDFTEVLQAATDSGIATGDAGGIIGITIGAYCPEHEGVIQ